MCSTTQKGWALVLQKKGWLEQYCKLDCLDACHSQTQIQGSFTTCNIVSFDRWSLNRMDVLFTPVRSHPLRETRLLKVRRSSVPFAFPFLLERCLQVSASNFLACIPFLYPCDYSVQTGVFTHWHAETTAVISKDTGQTWEWRHSSHLPSLTI